MGPVEAVPDALGGIGSFIRQIHSYNSKTSLNSCLRAALRRFFSECLILR